MKYLKYSLFLAMIVTFTSCLKSRSEQGGLLDDPGSIVTSIAEKAYMNTDAQNVQLGYFYSLANFNFTNRPNESVYFFTVQVSQPRTTKLSGPLVLKVASSDLSLDTDFATAWGTLDPLPAGAIQVTDIVIPQSDAASITVPVMYTVNKTLLNPANVYGIKFTLASASQGVVSSLDQTTDVLINASDNSVNTNASDYEAKYIETISVDDPVNQYGIHNTRPMQLQEVAANTLQYVDPFYYAAGAVNPFLVVINFSTGLNANLFTPRYVLNAAGQVTSVINQSGGTVVTNLQLDPTGLNRFVYMANNVRYFDVKYTFTLTTTINGVVTPRTVRVSESFKFDPSQVYF